MIILNIANLSICKIVENHKHKQNLKEYWRNNKNKSKIIVKIKNLIMSLIRAIFINIFMMIKEILTLQKEETFTIIIRMYTMTRIIIRMENIKTTIPEGTHFQEEIHLLNIHQERIRIGE